MAEKLHWRRACELRRRTRHEARCAADIAVLTFDAYDGLVEGWNALSAKDRAEYARECKVVGHLWAREPLGGHICRRCLLYRSNA